MISKYSTEDVQKMAEEMIFFNYATVEQLANLPTDEIIGMWEAMTNYVESDE